MNKQPGMEPAVAQFALAFLAFALTMVLAWPIYNGIGGHVQDVHSTSVVAPSGRDVWWWLGGCIAGAIAASAVLAVLWIAAMVRRETVWVLSLGSNLGVVVVSVLIAGFWFAGIHADQSRHQQQIAAEEESRQQEINMQEQARIKAKVADTNQRWDNATQDMAQLEPGSVASTLAAAEAQSPLAVLNWMQNSFEPFLDRHPWRTLSNDDRAAFDAFARSAPNTIRYQDSEVSVVLGMVIGSEHGLADTRGAMDECARLHSEVCPQSVAVHALYLCRNGPSCLDGYEGLDFAKLSKDISGPAKWSCTVPTQMHDMELCAYVRGEKH